jgi:broad specificity phosphatase PhoE
LSRKRVYLLRHGQTDFNAAFDINGQDPGIVDPRLTHLGHEQVRAIAPAVLALRADLVVASPARRTLETTLDLFAGGPMPLVLAEPLMRERLADPSDPGTPASDLAREFPMFDFSPIEELWWQPGPLDERGVPVESRESLWSRIQEFRAWLIDQPEESILLIGHWGFFRDIAGIPLANGELREWLTFPYPAPLSYVPRYPADRPHSQPV